MFAQEHRGNHNIEALTSSMFSDDLMSRGTPVLRLVALEVCLNLVTYVTIDFQSWTGPTRLNQRVSERRAGLRSQNIRLK